MVFRLSLEGNKRLTCWHKAMRIVGFLTKLNFITIMMYPIVSLEITLGGKKREALIIQLDSDYGRSNFLGKMLDYGLEPASKEAVQAVVDAHLYTILKMRDGWDVKFLLALGALSVYGGDGIVLAERVVFAGLGKPEWDWVELAGGLEENQHPLHQEFAVALRPLEN